MNKLDILDIHKQYYDIYEGYNLIGSYKLLIPFYKFEITYEFLKETRLTVIEEYICRCINMGINDIDEISFVLSIDKDIMDFYVCQLDELNYIVRENNKIILTEDAKILYGQLIKRVPQKENCDVFFDSLKGEYKINIVEKEDYDEYINFESAIRDDNSIILEPRILGGDKDEYLKSIKKWFLNNECGLKGVNHIDLMEDKELVYHSIELLLFEKMGKYKILCHDNCGNVGVDLEITGVIQKLYENNELHEVIKENTSLNGVLFTDILNNYEKELELTEDEDVKEIINDIKYAMEESNSLEYIMNYEIRKRFLNYLEEAKESLYIISPWMNNYIINNDFIIKLENLLKRGVKVRIIYGISSKEEINIDYRNRNTVTIANRLKEMAKPFGDLFRIEYGQTHEKLVICDREHYINGSFNFLSYSGETNGKFRNEGSTYSKNKKLINQTIKLRFNE